MNDFTLHCGDCVDLLPDYTGQVDLVVTSPPYDDLRDYGGHAFDFERVADALVPTLKEGGVLVWVVDDATIDGGKTGTSFRQAIGFMERGLRLHDTLIYQKHGSIPRTWKRRHRKGHEYMFVFARGQPATVNIIIDVPAAQQRVTRGNLMRGRDGKLALRENVQVTPETLPRDTVWRYPTGIRIQGHADWERLLITQHPATFPLALASDHVRTWTDEGALVLDPMMGSGTVVRAAVDLHRRAVGIDIHQPYVDLARRRMQQQMLL